MEYIMRLDFQWKQNLEREQKEADSTHHVNKLLLENILPIHVADMYLYHQYMMMEELYHESYEEVCVIFASIPNYSEFYKENEMNDEGKMCLRVLNEIISDFDMLTYDKQFFTIEKIKVVGSTYMAACGLQPGGRYSDDYQFEERDKKDHVATITKFAMAMFEKLKNINNEDLQDFKLRVGIDVGPVIAGVVGAKKPMYDIWGNTVNVASRMDYTGEEGKIHVTSEVGETLQELGWQVECRGEIYVKGKGPMTTYFVDPTIQPEEEPKINLTNNNNDNYDKNRRDSTNTERRRSSQLSTNSFKGLLSSHRGSLDISRSRDSSPHSSYSPILKMFKKCRDGGSIGSSYGESTSAGSSPRLSLDSHCTESQMHSLQMPSPVEEEIVEAVTAEDNPRTFLRNDISLQNGVGEDNDFLTGISYRHPIDLTERDDKSSHLNYKNEMAKSDSFVISRTTTSENMPSVTVLNKDRSKSSTAITVELEELCDIPL
ncbi:Adenylate and Guanylate cyclase catalytic domain [Halocaridina rubra]|uniref:adenylate cyclase n=1 Tax=Halocaridina rubra TaxID=373956 RepID=A0AAN8X7A3_HALRR